MRERIPQSALEGITILDLASELSAFGTKTLAELGAEVIRVEPPQGEKMRHVGPYFHGKPDVEGSLRHIHFNSGKRSITLDISRPRGAEVLRSLAKTADVLVEGFPPGYLDGFGLGYDDLRAVNPALIVASVTPFGQEGPHSRYLGTDIVGAAMGGIMVLNGFLEDPPAAPGAEQSYHLVGLATAAGIMVAIYGREDSPDGAGTHLDISMQDCVAMSGLQMANLNYYGFLDQVPKRKELREGSHHVRRCRDGWVSIATAQMLAWPRLLKWLRELGLEGELEGPVWQDQAYRLEHQDVIGRQVEQLCSRYTVAELCRVGQSREMLCMPVNTVADLFDDEQLKTWEAFVDVDYPELGERLRDVGAPFHLAETPWRIGRRAPRLGEDSEAIYKERLGLSAEELRNLRAEGII